MKKASIFFIVFILTVTCLAAEDWQVAKSTHFIVYFREGLNDFSEKVIEDAEDLYDEIADYLGFRRYNFWLWDNRAKIYIFSDAQDYQRSTQQPSWSGGYVVPQEKKIMTYPLEKFFFVTVLPHEMAHIIFREFVGFKNESIPIWLDEGIAGSRERLRRTQTQRVIKSAIINNKFINLKNLQLVNPRDISNNEIIDIFYAESISIVDFLLKEYGKDSFVFFCRELRDKKNFLAALSSAYHFENIEQLDAAWQDYLNDLQ